MKKIKMMLALLAALVCGGAWAATPIVVWDRDMSDATATRKGTDGNNYTITLNSGNTFDGGCLKIGNTATIGATIAIPTDGGKAYTVLIKYSNLSTPTEKTAIGGVSATPSNIKNIGVAVAANTLECKPFWNGNDYAYSDATPSLVEGSGYAQFCYKNGNRWRTWAGSTLSDDTAKEGQTCGLVFSSNIEKLAIGGPATTGGPAAWKGLVIESIALFKTDNQTAHADTKATIFPYTTPAYKATITDGDTPTALADLSWRDASGNVASYSAINDSDVIAVFGSGEVTSNDSFAGTLYLDKKVTFVTSTTTSIKFAGEGSVEYRINSGELTITPSFVGPVTVRKTGSGTLAMTCDLPQGITVTAAEGTLKFGSKSQYGSLETTVNVLKGATFVSTRAADSWHYNRGDMRFNIYGTLDMADTRLNINNGQTWNIYAGAIIKGAGQGNNRAFDYADASGNPVFLCHADPTGESNTITWNVTGRIRTRAPIFDIDAGVIVDLQNTQYYNATQTSIKRGLGTLKISAGGIFDSVNLPLNVEAGHLDLSELSTTAANNLKGNITLANGVVLHLPSGVEAGSAYTLCGGTLTPPTTTTTTIYVGDEAIAANLTFNADAKTVSYEKVRDIGKIYWKGSGAWNLDRDFYATAEKSDSDLTKMYPGDTIVFTEASTEIYAPSDISVLKLEVEAGKKLIIGHDSTGAHKNIPSGSTITINDGGYVGFAWWNNTDTRAIPMGDVEINGGTFGISANNSGKTLNMGKVTGSSVLVVNVGDNVTVESIETHPIAAEGKVLVTTVNDDGTTTYAAANPVASITKDDVTTYYATLDSAYAAAEADDVIDLTADVSGELAIPEDKVVDAGTHAISGAITIGTNAKLTLSGTQTINGVTGGGTLVINCANATDVITAKNKSSDYAVNGITVDIVKGKIELRLGNGDPKAKNTKFIVRENGTLTNYGYLTLEGTIEVETDYTKTIFVGSCFRGTPSFIKSGTGAVTFDLSGAANTDKFASMTINGGSMKLKANTTIDSLAGSGTFIYDANSSTTAPAITLANTWTGTVWLKNVKASNYANDKNQNVFATNVLAGLGNANSVVKMTNCAGYINENNNVNFAWTLELDGNGAWENLSGWSNRNHKFGGLKGEGVLDFFAMNSHCSEVERFDDAEAFRGSINVGDDTGSNYRGKRVIIGEENLATDDTAQILVSSDKTVTVASGKTWTAYKMVVNGTIKGAGTIAANLTFGNGATIDLTDNGGNVLSVADGKSVSISGSVKVVGATLGTKVFSLGSGATITGTSSVILVDAEGAETDGYIFAVADNGDVTISQITVATVNGVEYTSFSRAIAAAAEQHAAVVLSHDISASNETVPGGVVIELNGYQISGSLKLQSGAYILEGTGENKTVKIDGFATSIDVTYGSGTIGSCLKYSAFGGVSECNGNNPEYTTAGDAIKLSKNPWLKSVETFFTTTEQITFATAGIMPTANNTIFAHMGKKSGWGLFLATGTKDNEVIVGYNESATPHTITTINVPNARTHRHTYIITKDDDMSDPENTSTTFTIYLDGVKWKTFERKPRFEITGGFQVGSTFEGIISDYSAVQSSEASAYVNFMRAYQRIISQAEIDAYTTAYPYTSPNGTFKRSVTADGNWVSANTWNDETDKPASKGNVELSIDTDGDDVVTIDVNLTEEVEYEKLTIKSENGKGVKLVRSSQSAQSIKSVCTVIATDVTLGEGAIDLTSGPTIIADGGSLTFDFSGLRLAADEEFEQVLTGDIDETTAVKVIKPTDSGVWLELVYEGGRYKAVARETRQYWPTKTQYVWATTTDAEEGNHLNKGLCVGENGESATINSAKALYFDTDHWNNDNTLYLKGIVNPKIRVGAGVVLKIGHSGGDECNLNGGTVTIEDGAEVQLAYNNGNDDGSAVLKGTVTFNKVGESGTGFVSIRANDLTVPITGIAGTAPFSGNGHIIIDGKSATITTDPTINLGSGWTGTVELKNFAKNAASSSNYGVLDLNKYGRVGSTLALNGITTTPYAVGESGNTPAIVIGDLEIKEGGWKLRWGTLTSDDHYTANLKGSGTIQVSGFGNGNCQVVFKGDHSEFTGSIKDYDDGEYSSTGNHEKTKRVVFIGPNAAFPAANQEYGTIYVDQTSTMKLASTTTWQATNGIKVFGTLDLTSGAPTFVGTPSFGGDVTIKLAAMPADDPVKIINGEFTEAAEPLTLGLKIMVGEEIDRTHMITLKADGIYIEKNDTGRIQSLIVGSGENRTLTVETTLSCIAPPSLNAEGTITVDVAGLEAGAYDLVTWTGVLPRGHVGYGKPHVVVQNVPQGWEGKLVFQATKISLLLRNPEWLARKPLTIWPFGDSITEGFNNSNKANYRIQLFQKLELLGYNVKSVGWWTSNHDGQYSGCQSYDPTGTICQREDWSYHSGVRSARVMWENGSNNVLCDAVETGLDQAGDPDVVLLHIGTNDGASGATWENVYDGITNVAWRIINARENTKVVMSTILPLADGRDLNTTHIAKINQALKDAIAANVFPEGRVYLADLWSYVPTMGNGHSPVQNYVSDDTHPDWIGHDKMANGWLDTLTQIFTNKEDPRIQSNIGRTAPTADHQGAAANVPAEYRKGYRKLATMKPGAETHFAKNANAYTSTEFGVDGDTTLSNVAYYMELINKETKIHRFVWVDMAAFDGATFSACGFPTGANKQMVVQNLHVYANTGAIENVDPSDNTKTGFIEFSPYNYGSDKGAVEGAPNNAHGYDWSDTLQTSGGYGCFQIHRISPSAPRVTAQPAQILFAYNKWGDANTGVTEIGIGNFSQYSQSNMDYTGTAGHKNIDASAYEVINIEFWGKVPGCVVPDGSEVEVVEATTEEQALAGLTIATPSEADTAANAGADNELGQAQYLTLQATRVGESNKWKVQAVVDNAKLPETKKIDDTAKAFADAGGLADVAGAESTTNVAIPAAKVVPGLYYSVSFGTTPDNHTKESDRVLATGTDVTIPVPALGNEKVYYIKIKASATK